MAYFLLCIYHYLLGGIMTEELLKAGFIFLAAAIFTVINSNIVVRVSHNIKNRIVSSEKNSEKSL